MQPGVSTSVPSRSLVESPTRELSIAPRALGVRNLRDRVTRQVLPFVSPGMRVCRLEVVLGVVIAVVSVTGCGSDDTVTDGGAADAPARGGPVPMIVDYSPTLSDVPALMFLSTRSDVDLLAVTLAGTGESDCESGVQHTRALLVIAGHPNVPVACGPEEPMVGDRDWPLTFREASQDMRGVILPPVSDAHSIDAVDLLTETLHDADRQVTIVTLGPLTNLGHVFDAEPDLVAKVHSIVTMGGAFDVPGNVFDAGQIADAAPDAEWNVYIDPESVRVVLESGAPVTFVPLDATNFVPGGIGMFERLSATVGTDAGEAVRQLWEASLGTERSIAAEWWYFWDELTAVIAVDPSAATTSERSVGVEDSGATIERDDGVTASVASAADADQFERIFLETFAGGELPVIQLTSDEDRYLGFVRAAMLELGAAVDHAFAGVEGQADEVPGDELAARLVGEVFDAMATFHEALSGVEGSERMRTEQDALIDAAATFLAEEGTYLEILDAAAPSKPVGVDRFFEFFVGTADAAGLASPFEAFEAACGELELAAFGLGATDPICIIE
jgi:inosine-uridine nucleoside N-ribohydrolase